MTEVETLYKNASVKKYRHLDMNNKLGWKYPPFTAEKQIELIKWLSSKYGIYIVDKYSIGFGECIGDFCIKENFGEALAESINHLWQSLTEQEKGQIKEILKR